MKILVLVVATLGCGRANFDAESPVDSPPADIRVEIDSANPARAVPMFVQAAGAATTVGGATVSGTLPADIVAGNTLIVAVDYDPGMADAQITSVTDTLGNAFSNVFGPYDPVRRNYIFVAPIAIGGTDTVTVTTDMSTAGFELRLHEFSGLGPPGANPTSMAFGGQAGDKLGEPITTTELNDLIFVFSLSGRVRAASPFTEALLFEDDITEYLVAPMVGTYVPAVTNLDDSTWEISAVVLHAEEI